MKDKQFKIRIFVLATIFVLLVVVYMFNSGLMSTIGRYIKREQDEIKAYYTSLYFDTDGQGKSIAVESNEGYVEFNLMNYIDDNVTQRDIEYTIMKPSTFYDENGDPLASDQLASQDKLYVLDVWGKPKEVAKNTYLYDVEIVKNTGEATGVGTYKFTYEKLGTSAVGKTHHVNLKLNRNGSELTADENISIVVQLTKPYREVFIINMVASSRLITFSTLEATKFEVPFEELHIQSADLYGFYKSGDQRKSASYGSSNYQDLFTSKAIKLTLTWNGLIFDETILEDIHNGTLGNPDDDGTGSSINTDEYYLDITKSVIAKINATGSSGELVIYIPQGSDISLFFLKAAESINISASIEIYVFNDETNTYEYVLYNEKYFGFTYVDGKYTILN